MDKYEYKIRADEIKNLISQGEYAKAAELADSIDWSKVKKPAVLCTISDLYKKNRRYDDAIELMQLAYERNSGSRDIIYSLCGLYIKTGNIIKSVATYKEFAQIAPTDARRYILQYKIYEMQDISLEERIEVLEELKSVDYREKWGYTLAYLYHRVGLATKCVEECDELILWFGDGAYVYKAMELKMLHQPLTPSQQEKYDHRFDAVQTEDASIAVPNENDRGVGAVEKADDVQLDDFSSQAVEEYENNDPGDYSDGNTGKIAIESLPESAMESESEGLVPDKTISWTPIRDEDLANAQVPGGQTTVFDAGATSGVSKAEAIALSLGYTQVYHGMQPEPEIEVKPMDVGEYNTINLQKAIAEGVAEVLGSSDADTVSSVIKADTKEIPKNIVAEEAEDEAGETSDKTDETAEEVVEKVEDVAKEITEEAKEEKNPQLIYPVPDNTIELMNALNMQQTVEIASVSGGYDAEEMKEAGEVAPATNSQVVEEAMSAQPPEQIASVLTQEPDGQISLVIPEDRILLVKQITGQMNINDVMAEWGRMKREHEEYNRKQYHQQVMQQTGEIFNEFERAALNGVLEQLEAEAYEEALKRGDVVEPDTISEDDYESSAAEDEIGPDDQVEELTEIAEASEDTESEDESSAKEQTETIEETEEDTFEELEEIEEDSADAEVAEGDASEEDEVTEEVSETLDETKESDESVETEESELDDSETGVEVSEETEDEISEETEASEESESDTAAETPKRRVIPEFTEGGTASFRKNTKKNVAEAAPAEKEEEDDGEEVRDLTPEEMKIFGAYAQSKSSKKQLVKVIDGISLSSYTGNVVITGGDNTDVSNLATNLMKNVMQSDSNFSGKVAVISAKKFNTKKVGGVLKQLSNGGLILQNASALDEKTATDLYKCLDQDNLGIVIVLLDTKKNMDKLFEMNPKLAPFFSARMNIKALSADQLASYAVKYAYDKEFSIDQMGMLALHRRIEAKQTATHSVNVVEVKEIVDDAIAHVKRKTLGHFFETLSGKRYDDEDMIILGEKDFDI